MLFAYSTILGRNYYGEKALEYLAGHTRWAKAYRVAWVVATFFGATLTLDTVWAVSDAMNGAMAIPNLIGLIGLITAETADYLGARAEEPQRT